MLSIGTFTRRVAQGKLLLYSQYHRSCTRETFGESLGSRRND